MKHVESAELCEIIKNYTVFGLNQSINKKCKSLYILDSYYDRFKTKIESLNTKIFIYNLKSIKRARESIGRPHKISVIGVQA